MIHMVVILVLICDMYMHFCYYFYVCRDGDNNNQVKMPFRDITVMIFMLAVIFTLKVYFK